MEKHYRFTDQQFEERFSTCRFPGNDFTHEAHIRLAWIHLHRYGIQKAIEHVTHQIKAFSESLEVSENYHHTVTTVAVYAVAHFYTRSESSTFETFIEEFPQLKTNFRALLSSHYSYDVVKSDQAKKEYQEPDLVPFF